ncbi:hypothetical protein ABW20_dc0101506 [Dactylellina cionopaga]|nr:hypothetical protein ABW20_dc0101506 [Dactylellina cionopaga]
MYLGIGELTDHVLDYIAETLETDGDDHIEGSPSDNLSLEYLVTLIQGLAFRKHHASNNTRKFNTIFEKVVKHFKFDAWLKEEDFTRMLDRHPDIARVMLCKYSKIKLFKVEQELNSLETEDENTKDREKIFTAAALLERTEIFRKSLSKHATSLEEFKKAITELVGRHSKKLDDDTVVLQYLMDEMVGTIGV